MSSADIRYEDLGRLSISNGLTIQLTNHICNVPICTNATYYVGCSWNQNNMIKFDVFVDLNR
jgi:hypothetical protein